MTPETMRQEIEELEDKGWKADSAPRAMRKHYQFESFAETVKFLMEVGEMGELFSAMPSIRIDNGTEVRVRVGRPPTPTLTADELELTKALAEI